MGSFECPVKEFELNYASSRELLEVFRCESERGQSDVCCPGKQKG